MVRLHAAEISTLVKSFVGKGIDGLKSCFGVVFNIYAEELDSLIKISFDACGMYHAYKGIVGKILKQYGLEAQQDFLCPEKGNQVYVGVLLGNYPELSALEKETTFMKHRYALGEMLSIVPEHTQIMSELIIRISRLSRGQYWVDNPAELAKHDCKLRGLLYFDQDKILDYMTNYLNSSKTLNIVEGSYNVKKNYYY